MKKKNWLLMLAVVPVMLTVFLLSGCFGVKASELDALKERIAALESESQPTIKTYKSLWCYYDKIGGMSFEVLPFPGACKFIMDEVTQ